MTLLKKILVTLAACSICFIDNFKEVQAAALTVISESAVVNNKTQEVLFTINFNKPPDFFSVDEFGRQADSFQYFIEASGTFPIFRGSPYYSEVDTIIRGEEIHVGGNIRFRGTGSSSNNPTSGGWGNLRGSVPYILNDNTLTFSAPLRILGDSDGFFSYRLEWYEFGSGVDFKENKSVLSQKVHEPSLILSVLTFAVVSAGLLIKHKQTKNRHQEGLCSNN